MAAYTNLLSTSVCINTHSENGLSTTTEANIYRLPYLRTWGHSQSQPRKRKGTPGLAALQKQAKNGEVALGLCNSLGFPTYIFFEILSEQNYD